MTCFDSSPVTGTLSRSITGLLTRDDSVSCGGTDEPERQGVSIHAHGDDTCGHHRSVGRRRGDGSMVEVTADPLAGGDAGHTRSITRYAGSYADEKKSGWNQRRLWKTRRRGHSEHVHLADHCSAVRRMTWCYYSEKARRSRSCSAGSRSRSHSTMIICWVGGELMPRPEACHGASRGPSYW